MTEDRILILGAGRGQVGLIAAAKRLGVSTIVASLPSERAPGLELADDIAWADIADPAQVLKAAHEFNVTAVATSCADTGLDALGHVCDELGLVGLSSRTARLCSDKLLMKDAFKEAGVRTADYVAVSELSELDDAISTLGFPLIIKATDLQGSKGISIVRDCDEAVLGFDHAMKSTSKPYVIIEQFIEGEEFGAQALVVDGDIKFVVPHGDEVFMARTAVPVGHFIPLDKDESVLSEAKIEVEKAIRAVGLNDCAVNVDLIVRDSEIFVIEITGRVGANGLPELMSSYLGRDYYEVIAEVALGLRPAIGLESEVKRARAAGVRMLIAPHLHGKLTRIALKEVAESRTVVTVFAKEGDMLRGFSSSADCLGQVVVEADSLDEALEMLDRTERHVVLEVERSSHE